MNSAQAKDSARMITNLDPGGIKHWEKMNVIAPNHQGDDGYARILPMSTSSVRA